MIRRLLGVLLVGIAFAALAGCGSSTPAAKSNGADLGELSYFPSGSPFVLSLTTNPNSPAIKALGTLENKFQAVTQAKDALFAKLQQLGISYANDIRPLFGHPVALGATTGTLGAFASGKFLIVWQTQDAAKLQALLNKLHGIRQSGSHEGAKLYAVNNTELAIDGPTLIFGPSASVVSAALDRHAHGGGIGSAEYARETSGLPSGSLLQIFGNLSAELATRGAQKARRIPWVAALRGYGLSLSANSSGATLRFHLDTTGVALTQNQLPFASGAATPSLSSSAPISVGLHDPSQVLTFAEQAAQAVSPGSYGRFLSKLAKVKARTGVDLASFAKLLTGDLIISSDTHTTIGRVGVSDPATAAQDISKLSSAGSGFFGRRDSVTQLPGGLYSVNTGKTTITLGVFGNQIVAGNTTPTRLRAFAATPTVPAAGAQGAIAFRVDLVQLLSKRLKGATSSSLVQSILSHLGAITGWGSSSLRGIDGSASLALK